MQAWKGSCKLCAPLEARATGEEGKDKGRPRGVVSPEEERPHVDAPRTRREVPDDRVEEGADLGRKVVVGREPVPEGVVDELRNGGEGKGEGMR